MDFILHVYPILVQKLSYQAWICFYLVGADDWQMRMLSAKLDYTGQIFSGKLRVNDDVTFKLQFYGFWRIGIKTIHQKYARKNLYNFWIENSSSGWTKHSQPAQGFYKQAG